MSTSRSYCFTAFQEEPPTNGPRTRYLIYQREVCPETNRAHWQGYAEFYTPLRIPAAQRELGIPGCHMELRRGTREQARDYCRKEQSRMPATDPVELGTFDSGGQGTRSDIDQLWSAIAAGGTETDIAATYPAFIRYHSGISKAIQLRDREARRGQRPDVVTTVLVGPAGSGKTRKVFDTCGDDLYVLETDSAVWWNGYDGQSNLLLDDFYGGIRYSTLLRLLDRYPVRLPTKGGFTYAGWNHVWITSNVKPDKWYRSGYTAALQRRITSVEFLGDPDVIDFINPDLPEGSDSGGDN